MRKIFTAALLILFIGLSAYSQEITKLYFIRHAEKDRSDTNNKNPELKTEGLHRALFWKSVFKDVPLDAVYTTNYKRTIQTARPTAESKGLILKYYDPSTLNNAEFIRQTKGKTVLIVGHSNTTPAFVNAVLNTKKFEAIDDNNNSNLYIVTGISGQWHASVLYLPVNSK